MAGSTRKYVDRRSPKYVVGERDRLRRIDDRLTLIVTTFTVTLPLPPTIYSLGSGGCFVWRCNQNSELRNGPTCPREGKQNNRCDAIAIAAAKRALTLSLSKWAVALVTIV